MNHPNFINRKGNLSMKNEKEKKGLFGRLIGGKKDQKNSCCSFQVIELPEDGSEEKESTKPSNAKDKK